MEKKKKQQNSFQLSYIDSKYIAEDWILKIPKKLYFWRFYYKLKLLKPFKNIIIYLDVVAKDDAFNLLNENDITHITDNCQDTGEILVLTISSDNSTLQTNIYNKKEQKEALLCIISEDDT
jgi:hypothetical protein